MPKKFEITLTYNDLNKLTLEELRTYTKRLNTVANLRLKSLKEKAPFSPALRAHENSGIGTFRAPKNASVNELRKRAAQATKFINMKTSTVKGTYNNFKKLLHNAGIDLPTTKKELKENYGTPKKRGRPKGSKDSYKRGTKPKKIETSEIETLPKKRGRPKGSKNKSNYYSNVKNLIFDKNLIYLKQFFDLYNKWKEIQKAFPGDPPSEMIKICQEFFKAVSDNPNHPFWSEGEGDYTEKILNAFEELALKMRNDIYRHYSKYDYYPGA